MLNIWELYQRQVVADHRTVLINKVMYVNMMIVSYLFHQPHARVGPETEDVRYEYDKGFETVLYNVTLKVGLGDLGGTLFYKYNEDFKITGRDSHVWSQSGVEAVNSSSADQIEPNPPFDYFIRRHVRPLSEEQIGRLAESFNLFVPSVRSLLEGTAIRLCSRYVYEVIIISL